MEQPKVDTSLLPESDRTVKSVNDTGRPAAPAGRRPWTPPVITDFGALSVRTNNIRFRPGDGLSNLT